MTRLLLAAAVLLVGCQKPPTQSDPQRKLASATYSGIYEQPVTLVDGVYRGEPFVPGAASRPEVTLMTDQHWELDLNGDGSPEILTLLSESSGGSGTFVYLALMQPTATGYQNIDTVLLGDRLRVIGVQLQEGLLGVQIEERRQGPASAGTPESQLWWQFTAGGLVPLQAFAGRLTLGHEVREFASCADPGAPVWVADETGGVLADAAVDLEVAAYQSFFATFLGSIAAAPDAGFAEPFTRQVRIAQLWRVEREGHGCNLDLGGASYRAMGSEPFWSLEVFADRLEFRALGAPMQTFIRDASASADASAEITFDGRSAEGLPLTLQLRREVCRDSMVGSRYRWQAQVTLMDRQLSGCALTALPDQ